MIFILNLLMLKVCNMEIFIVIMTDERINILGAYTSNKLAKDAILSSIKYEYEVENAGGQMELLAGDTSRFGSILIQAKYFDKFLCVIGDNSILISWDEIKRVFIKEIDDDDECTGFIADYKIVKEKLQS